MFAKISNASKAAFLTLAKFLFKKNTAFIDCQVYTAHLESLGGQEISRADFLALLRGVLQESHPRNDQRGKWNADS
jgi:leucyl/phenylalanyl-tRNA--protein transferase